MSNHDDWESKHIWGKTCEDTTRLLGARYLPLAALPASLQARHNDPPQDPELGAVQLPTPAAGVSG